MFYTDAIEKLIEKMERARRTPIFTEGWLLTTGAVICESAEGFYIGEWCVEVMEDGELLPQPFSRDTFYMTKEQAQHYMEECF